MVFLFSPSKLSLPENGKLQDTGLKNKAQFYYFALGAGLDSYGGKGEHTQSKSKTYGTDCELDRTASEAFDCIPSESFTVKTKRLPNMHGQHEIRISTVTCKS